MAQNMWDYTANNIEHGNALGTKQQRSQHMAAHSNTQHTIIRSSSTIGTKHAAAWYILHEAAVPIWHYMPVLTAHDSP